MSKRKLFGTLAYIVVGFVRLFLPALVFVGLLVLVLVAVIGLNYREAGHAGKHPR